MKRIKNALRKNPNLLEEVKVDVLENIQILIDCPYISQINVDYIASKLEKLSIEFLPKFGECEDIKTVGDAEVQIDKDLFNEKGGQNINMQCILKALYPNNSFAMIAIHNGLTEQIANMLVGGSCETDEFITCDLLPNLLDPENPNLDILLDAYFKGDMASVIPYLEEKIGKDKTKELLSLCSQNYMTRKTREQSLLPSIQKLIIEEFYNQQPSLEATRDLDSRLALNLKLFDKPEQYKELDKVADTYNSLKSEYTRNYVPATTKTI